MSKILNRIFLSTILCFAGISHAAIPVIEDFEAGLGSWEPNTTQTNITHEATGGNPDGYLVTDNLRRPQNFHTVGAVNKTSDYSGVFAEGVWTISVDLNFLRGDFDDARLRFRFQDSTANGWYISLEDTVFENEWTSYAIKFDTTWDDADAQNAGWVKEADGPTATPSFNDLWDNVYTSEVRILGTPNSNTLLAGIDNYQASIVPIPAAVWLLGSGLLAFMSLTRRKID